MEFKFKIGDAVKIKNMSKILVIQGMYREQNSNICNVVYTTGKSEILTTRLLEDILEPFFKPKEASLENGVVS